MGEKLFWTILGFAFGFGAGGYFIGSNVSKKAKQRIADLEEELEQKKTESEEEEEEERERPERRRRVVYHDIASIDDLIDDDFANSGIEEDTVEEGEEEGKVVVETSDAGDYILIDEDQFKEDLPFRNDETIYYYKHDGVLVDSNLDKIDDPKEVIGSECLELLKTTDKDYIYLSNEIEDKMYEIFVDKKETYYKDMMAAHVADDEEEEEQ